MLPSSHRLRTSEVVEVLKRGRSLSSGKYLSAKVFYPPSPMDVTIRSAAVISKKVASTAVVRNRVRRALYDAIRTVSLAHRATAEGSKSAHVVFFVRSIPGDSLRNEFKKDIIYILGSLAARR